MRRYPLQNLSNLREEAGVTDGRQTGGCFTALILAAARGQENEISPSHGGGHKCLVPLHGVSMLAWVIDALRKCPEVGRLLVSFDDPEVLRNDTIISPLLEDGTLSIIASAASPARSVMAAAQLDDDFPLLVTTADSPLLTPEMVGEFCRSARQSNADIVVAVATESTIRREFPNSHRTYLRFREARYSGCNLFALVRPTAVRAAEFWCGVEANRKRPWRLAAAFGIGSLLLFFLRQLTLKDAMLRASKRLDVTAHAVVLPYPAAALDVDKPSDLALAADVLRTRTPPTIAGMRPGRP